MGQNGRKKNAVERYLRALEKAGNYDRNPYKYIIGINPARSMLGFLYKGLTALPGCLTIPTILIPRVKVEDIWGVIVGDDVQTHPDLRYIPERVKRFTWDELAKADLGHPYDGYSFAVKSHRARYAQALQEDRGEKFLREFTPTGGGLLTRYLDLEKPVKEKIRERDRAVIEGVRNIPRLPL